jgi:hypothetical protein
MAGQDITAGELQFLEIFRCIVETDQVLTPLLAEGVKCEFPDSQMEMPLVSVRCCRLFMGDSAHGSQLCFCVCLCSFQCARTCFGSSISTLAATI